ncbi:MAG: hypothetical protein ACM3TR_14035 [Caulobacteraceae bacterium]
MSMNKVILKERIFFGKEFEPLLEPWFATAKKNGMEKTFRNQVNEVCLTIRHGDMPLPHWNDRQRELYLMLLAKRIKAKS